MNNWQSALVTSWGVLAFLSFLYALWQTSKKGNVYRETYVFWIFGAFVMGDLVVFGLFWAAVSLVTFYLKDWLLFLLIYSSFWLVRSVGETIYWLLPQFTPVKRELPQKWWHYKIFKNDSVWFVNQIAFQCLTVVTLVTTVHLAKLWLDSF